MVQTLSHHRTADSSISTEVVAAVSDVTGSEPDNLEPLFATIDPDALNALFEPTAKGAERSPTQVTFAYAGCEVVVRGDGTVQASRIGRESAT